MTTTTTIPEGRIGELVRYFLRLGCLGFGGPVALVGQMERELVNDRNWLTKEQMREAIAICQSLPVRGRIDHMAVDLKRQRLFVSELGNGRPVDEVRAGLTFGFPLQMFGGHPQQAK